MSDPASTATVFVGRNYAWYGERDAMFFQLRSAGAMAAMGDPSINDQPPEMPSETLRMIIGQIKRNPALKANGQISLPSTLAHYLVNGGELKEDNFAQAQEGRDEISFYVELPFVLEGESVLLLVRPVQSRVPNNPFFVD